MTLFHKIMLNFFKDRKRGEKNKWQFLLFITLCYHSEFSDRLSDLLTHVTKQSIRSRTDCTPTSTDLRVHCERMQSYHLLAFTSYQNYFVPTCFVPRQLRTTTITSTVSNYHSELKTNRPVRKTGF